MKKRWIASFALSLGFLATTAQAGDEAWRVAPSKPAAPVVAPAAQIGRPIAIDPIPTTAPDNQVRPTAYDNAVAPPPLIQMQATDLNAPKPLPFGAPSSSGTAVPVTPSSPPVTNQGPAIKAVPLEGDTLSAPRLESPSTAGSIWSHFDPLSNFGGDNSDCGTPCFSACCADGCCYNPGNRFYMDAEVLMWWMKGNKVPPLVTTGSAADAVPGALGQPGTKVLFGNSDLASNLDAGGRFTMGYWFSSDHCLGVEGSFWFLGTKSNNFLDNSNGNPLLFRPFTDETGAQNVELVAVPSPTGPGLNGTVSVNSKTSYWGADTDLRANLCCGPHWFLDGLAGFRTMGLDDTLSVNESLDFARGAFIPDRGITVPAGTTFAVGDRFATQNRFYGGQVGLDWEYRLSNWIFGVKGKLAVGETAETVNISGNTVIAMPGAAASSFNGGLLAQPSNIGEYKRNRFAVVPEADLQIGYQFNDHWRVFMGYNAIYWSNVVRSGSQIDLNVNRNQLPPPISAASTPAFAFHTTDFWAQGMEFGVEFKW